MWLPIFLKNIIKTILDLIAVSETAHTAHDAEDIVIGGINTNLGIGVNSLGCEGKLKSGVIDAGHVACSGWLVLFRLKTKRVNVDTSLGDIGVVLVRLDKVEVSAISFGETVVTVELEFGGVDTVFTFVKERKVIDKTRSVI